MLTCCLCVGAADPFLAERRCEAQPARGGGDASVDAAGGGNGPLPGRQQMAVQGVDTSNKVSWLLLTLLCQLPRYFIWAEAGNCWQGMLADVRHVAGLMHNPKTGNIIKVMVRFLCLVYVLS